MSSIAAAFRHVGVARGALSPPRVRRHVIVGLQRPAPHTELLPPAPTYPDEATAQRATDTRDPHGDGDDC